MPIPSQALYSVTLRQSFDGQNIENVFYYWESNEILATSLAALGTSFDTLLMAELAAITSLSLSFLDIVVKDVLGIVPDQTVTPSQADGDLGGEFAPTYVSQGFTLHGLTKETRSGAKRIAGQSESVINGNVIIATYRTDCETLAALMDNTITDGTTAYGPVIFGVPNLNRATNIVNPVGNVTVDPFITTQNSRKRRL